MFLKHTHKTQKYKQIDAIISRILHHLHCDTTAIININYRGNIPTSFFSIFTY